MASQQTLRSWQDWRRLGLAPPRIRPGARGYLYAPTRSAEAWNAQEAERKRKDPEYKPRPMPMFGSGSEHPCTSDNHWQLPEGDKWTRLCWNSALAFWRPISSIRTPGDEQLIQFDVSSTFGLKCHAIFYSNADKTYYAVPLEDVQREQLPPFTQEELEARDARVAALRTEAARWAATPLGQKVAEVTEVDVERASYAAGRLKKTLRRLVQQMEALPKGKAWGARVAKEADKVLPRGFASQGERTEAVWLAARTELLLILMQELNSVSKVSATAGGFLADAVKDAWEKTKTLKEAAQSARTSVSSYLKEYGKFFNSDALKLIREWQDFVLLYLSYLLLFSRSLEAEQEERELESGVLTRGRLRSRVTAAEEGVARARDATRELRRIKGAAARSLRPLVVKPEEPAAPRSLVDAVLTTRTPYFDQPEIRPLYAPGQRPSATAPSRTLPEAERELPPGRFLPSRQVDEAEVARQRGAVVFRADSTIRPAFPPLYDSLPAVEAALRREAEEAPQREAEARARAELEELLQRVAKKDAEKRAQRAAEERAKRPSAPSRAELERVKRTRENLEGAKRERAFIEAALKKQEQAYQEALKSQNAKWIKAEEKGLDAVKKSLQRSIKYISDQEESIAQQEAAIKKASDLKGLRGMTRRHLWER